MSECTITVAMRWEFTMEREMSYSVHACNEIVIAACQCERLPPHTHLGLIPPEFPPGHTALWYKSLHQVKEFVKKKNVYNVFKSGRWCIMYWWGYGGLNFSLRKYAKMSLDLVAHLLLIASLLLHQVQTKKWTCRDEIKSAKIPGNSKSPAPYWGHTAGKDLVWEQFFTWQFHWKQKENR